MLKRYITEKRNTVGPKIVGLFNSSSVNYEPDFEDRLELFESIFEDVTGKNPYSGDTLSIYVDNDKTNSEREIDKRINVLDIDEDIKTYWKDEIKSHYNKNKNSGNFEGLNLLFPDGVGPYKTVELIYILTDYDLRNKSVHTETWALIHEINHHLNPRGKNTIEVEQWIQKQTYQKLYSLSMVDDIGVSFLNMMLDEAKGNKNEDVEKYNIFIPILVDLLDRDRDLLYAYLEMAMMLDDEDMSKLAAGIMEQYELSGSSYEGMWY